MDFFQVFSIIFGVGAIVWWQISLTNKRIDDIKDEINNHIRTDLKDLRQKIEKVQEDGHQRDRKIDKILAILEKDKNP